MFNKMVHYVARNQDGTIHVTNAVGGFIGQHHVHDPEGFESWKYAGAVIEEQTNVQDCDCGLAVGETKSGL